MKAALFFYARLLTCGLAASSWLPTQASAQGKLTVVQTGTGPGPLVSATFSFDQTPNNVPIVLDFEFGFTTDETNLPGSFLDSLTAAIGNATSSNYLPLVTVDAAGIVWAPGGPGTLPLADADVGRQPIGYPSLAPLLAQHQAWSVQVPLPKVLAGVPLIFHLDLFDNGNAVASAGWISDVQIIAVPEPDVRWLMMAGLAALVFQRRRSKT